MASVEKFTAHAVVNQLRHIERTIANPSNEDIDPTRENQNYSLAPDRGMSSYDYFKKRKAELYCYGRDDVKVMAGWIVTAPRDLPADQHEAFFQSTHNFLIERYGEANCIQSIVHNDESGQPHFAGASEQNTAGCKQSADAVLKLFATNERVKRTIRRPYSQEVAFTPSRLEKNNVFVVVDDSKLKLYAPLLHIITAQSLEYFSNRSNDSKTTILFCLDEFASLGKMEITDALRKLRKKHVRIMMLTQSMADIDLIYGHDERMAMMNNYRFKVVLGADDTDTQEYFAKLIGYQDTKKHSTSSNANQTTYTESEAKEWVIEPAELARLGKELVLLHPDGHMKLKKNFYYK